MFTLLLGEIKKLLLARYAASALSTVFFVTVLFAALYPTVRGGTTNGIGELVKFFTTGAHEIQALDESGDIDEQIDTLSARFTFTLDKHADELAFYRYSDFKASYADYLKARYAIIEDKICELEKNYRAFDGSIMQALALALEFDELYNDYIDLLKNINGQNPLLFKSRGLAKSPVEVEEMASALAQRGAALTVPQLSAVSVLNKLENNDPNGALFSGRAFLTNLEDFLSSLSLGDDTAIVQNLDKATTAVVDTTTYAKLSNALQLAQKQGERAFIGLKSEDASQRAHAFKSLSALTTYLESYFTTTQVLNSIEKNNISDKEVGEMSGLFLSSPYALRAQNTRALFGLEIGEEAVALSDLKDVAGFMDFCFVVLSAIITLVAVIIASSMIAGEVSDGTLKMLLMRPHTRSKILSSKLLTLAFIILTLTSICFGLTYVIGGLFWGFKTTYIVSIFNSSSAFSINALGAVAINYAALAIYAMLYALIALCVSALTKSRAVAAAISLFIYFAGSLLNLILAQFDFYKYMVFNNADLSVYFQNGSLHSLNFWFSLALCIGYAALFTYLSYSIFKRQDAK